MFDFDELDEAFTRVEEKQQQDALPAEGLTGFGTSFAVKSFASVDTKQSGTINLAVLDETSQSPAVQDSAPQPAAPSRPEISRKPPYTFDDLSDVDFMQEHVKAVLRGKDPRSVTPKSVMLDLESRLGLAPGELRGLLPLIKQLAMAEVKQMGGQSSGGFPAGGLGGDSPLPPENLSFSVSFEDVEKLRRSIAERPAPEPGSVEEKVSKLVSWGKMGAAVGCLTDRLRQLQTPAVSASNTTRRRAKLLVMRGHLYWKDLRYMKAYGDFMEAEELQPGGPASASLLALRFVLNLALDVESIPGQDELKKILNTAVAIHTAKREAMARFLQILRPRTAEPDLACRTRRIMARGTQMQIFDGTCSVPAYENYPAAKIGYRILVNRSVPLRDAPLLVYYHGNGEVAEEYATWADVYEKLPCSIIIFDYRAYGWSSGEAEIGCLAKDPVSCLEQLPSVFQSHELPWPWPAPLVLMGRSLGSGVVCRLVSLLPEMFDGLIIDSGGAKSKEDLHRELLEWMDYHGKPRGEAESAIRMVHNLVADSLPLGCEPGQALIAPLGTCDGIRSYRGPVLILHGQLDWIVPPENGKRNYEAATNACERELVEMPSDHNNCAGIPDYWRKQKSFLQRIMQRSKEIQIE